MRFRYDKNNEELIVSASTRIEYHQLGLWLTRFVKGHKFLPAVKMGVWDGKINYFRDGKINIGLWKECYKACREIGASFIIDNKEDFPINRDVTIEAVRDFCKNYFSNHKVRDKEGNWINFNPYDHQIESVFKILKNRYCIGEIATSGGKSLILSIIIFYILKNINPAAKILIIVPSITLVTQLYDDITENNMGLNNIEDIRDRKLDILLNNSIYCDIRIEEIMSDAPRRHSGIKDPNVVIGTFQSLEKRDKEFFSQFYMVAVDECLHPDTLIKMANNTYKKISDISEGEYVKTINEKSKEIENKRVDYVYKNLSIGETMYELEMEDGSFINITGNHKVYTTDFEWKRIDELTLYDEIIDFNFNI